MGSHYHTHSHTHTITHTHTHACTKFDVLQIKPISKFPSNFWQTPGTQEILIIPKNAKNLKEVSPSSMSFRGPPPFNLRSFGVKKIKMKKKKRRDASSQEFDARR